MSEELIYAIIAAGAGVLGSLIGAIATILSVWISKRLQTEGKLLLQAKIVHTPGKINQPWSFSTNNSTNTLTMILPLWLEVCNTSGIPRILRNVNVSAYRSGVKIVDILQMQRIGDIPLGDNESYSLVVAENSSRRFNLLFSVQEKDIDGEDKSFDELVLNYLDEKNQMHSFLLSKVENCWVKGEVDHSHQWIDLIQEYTKFKKAIK